MKQGKLHSNMRGYFTFCRNVINGCKQPIAMCMSRVDSNAAVTAQRRFNSLVGTQCFSNDLLIPISWKKEVPM